MQSTEAYPDHNDGTGQDLGHGHVHEYVQDHEQQHGGHPNQYQDQDHQDQYHEKGLINDTRNLNIADRPDSPSVYENEPNHFQGNEPNHYQGNEQGHYQGNNQNTSVIVPEAVLHDNQETAPHYDDGKVPLNSALASAPDDYDQNRREYDQDRDNRQQQHEEYPNGEDQSYHTRPSMQDRPSRSYIQPMAMPIPIVTTYEHEAPDNASVNKRRSVAGSKRAPSMNGNDLADHYAAGFAAGQARSQSRAGDYDQSARSQSRAGDYEQPARSQSRAGDYEQPARSQSRAGDYNQTAVRSPSRAADYDNTARTASRAPSRATSHRGLAGAGIAGAIVAPSIAAHKNETVRSPSRASGRGGDLEQNHTPRSPSVAGSTRRSDSRQNVRINGGSGAGVGEVISPDRQRQMQQGQERERPRVSLHDEPTNRDPIRSTSPRPMSPFGHRPQPNLMTVTEDGGEQRQDGRDSRSAGLLNRSGTTMSRANTLGRNGTMSRATNGGTIGTRRGAFGRGAGTSIGTQPEEVLGRDDIHTRAELSERILDNDTLRRLTTMEKKDAKRLSKVIKAEAKSEQKAVSGSIRELERLTELQRQAARAERKSQLRLTKWTGKEHKARLRFLKEKERYEKVEGELRNAENDYEERRDHAAGLTAQVAEKTQELDDLRGQKAADDRERAVKLLALKNPAHS